MGKFRDEAQRRIDRSGRDLADNVTPAKAFFSRRKFMVAAAGVGIAGSGLGLALAPEGSLTGGGANPVKDASLKPNSFADITQYNNFYEFGLGKDDPAKTAHALTASPWSIEITGLVERPGSYSLQEIVSQMMIEERIYRFRCVEAWSMVVPWSGFELRQLLEMVGIKQSATHVAFETLVRPSEMWAQSGRSLEWPYREGLRLDEAMHPLTLMATGIYGKPIPNQNGAPVRLVVPWKYGFKSIKSIVRIEVTDAQPQSTWNMQNPSEYGFYSNVNPSVDHKRWSQATERKVGGGLLSKRQPTLMFNGYEDEVAHLYDGMDLRKNF